MSDPTVQNRWRIIVAVAMLVGITLATWLATRQPSQPSGPAQVASAALRPKGMAVFGPSASTAPAVVQQALDGGVDLGGYTSDAGAVQITDAGTPLLVGCDVCADDGNGSAIYCAADPSVNATTGSAHKGIPLSPTTQLCRLFPVGNATQVYCAANASALPFVAHCY